MAVLPPAVRPWLVPFWSTPCSPAGAVPVAEADEVAAPVDCAGSTVGVLTTVRTTVDGSTVWPAMVVEGVTTDVMTWVVGDGVDAVVVCVTGATDDVTTWVEAGA